jgi:hypothetical protein
VTKITDPPPPPSEAEAFAESQVRWKNKHEFLKVPLANLDALNVDLKPKRLSIPHDDEPPSRKFS